MDMNKYAQKKNTAQEIIADLLTAVTEGKKTQEEYLGGKLVELAVSE